MRLRLALISALFPEQKTICTDAIARGAGAAHASVLSQRYRGKRVDDGTIVISEPDRPSKSFAVDYAGLVYPDWLKGFSLALIARNRSAINTLAIVTSIEACARPPEIIDTFWPLFCGAFAAAVVEPEAAPEWIKVAEKAIQDVRIASPNLIEFVYRPLLGLLKALTDETTQAFNLALLDALHAHRQYYSRPDQIRNWNGIVALLVIGLCALGFDRDMPIAVEADYLPKELLRGDFPRNLTEVSYHYPLCSIGTADEARWFLDLEGIPRANCSHVIVEQGNQLLARYEIRDAPGLSHAIADFVLPDPNNGADTTATSTIKPALDPGELLYLAEVYSS